MQYIRNNNKQANNTPIGKLTDKFKNLGIGDWTRPEGILDLLHETGHTHQNFQELRQVLGDIEGRLNTSPDFIDSEEYRNFIRKQAFLESQHERNAWAFALRAIRTLRDKTGINVGRQIFGNSDDVMSYINKWLQSHKTQSSQLLLEDQDFQQFLNTLFI